MQTTLAFLLALIGAARAETAGPDVPVGLAPITVETVGPAPEMRPADAAGATDRRVAVRGLAVGGRGVHVFALRDREVAGDPPLYVFLALPAGGVPEGLEVLVVGTVQRADAAALREVAPDLPPAVAADLQGRPILVAQAIRGENGADYVVGTALADAVQADAADIAARPGAFAGQVVAVSTEVERALDGDRWALRAKNGLPLYALVPQAAAEPAEGTRVAMLGTVRSVVTAGGARAGVDTFGRAGAVTLARRPIILAESAITPIHGDVVVRAGAASVADDPPALLVLGQDVAVDGEGVVLDGARVERVTSDRALRIRTADGRSLGVLLPGDLSTADLRPGDAVDVEGVLTSAGPNRAAMDLSAADVRGLGAPYVFATRVESSGRNRTPWRAGRSAVPAKEQGAENSRRTRGTSRDFRGREGADLRRRAAGEALRATPDGAAQRHAQPADDCFTSS